MCQEERSGRVSCNVFCPPAKPGMKQKQQWAPQKEACVVMWEWFTGEVMSIQRNKCIWPDKLRFDPLSGKKGCTYINCMCISSADLAAFTSWGSVIWAGGEEKLCSWCGCMWKFISLRKYPHPGGTGWFIWGGTLTFAAFPCAGPSQEQSSGGVLLCPARQGWRALISFLPPR